MVSIINIDISQLTVNLNDDIGYLELCIGPMFAGKTTHLINIINDFNSKQIKFTVVKPKIDNRYNEDKITSHDNISYNCITIQHLYEIHQYNPAKYILIEEGQFFPDLYETVNKLINSGFKLYIAGLNGDYKMNELGDINKLIPRADNIIYKTAVS